MPFLPLVDVFGDQVVLELFSERAQVEGWLGVERALAQAQAELGIVPAGAAELIAAEATFEKIDLDRLHEQTRVVGYPILPLLEQITSASPSDVARYLHWGATTQDVMDTGLALTLTRALDRVEALLQALGDAVASKAHEHRATVMAGRTHAQPAVPITFGGKLAVWLAELTRHRLRLHTARDRVSVVQLFGAAGTAAALGPESRAVRHGVAARLGLGVVDVTWHTARDGLAEAGFALAALAATCGKIGREVVELSRPEIGEVREAGGHNRGASSTMPQKANPIDSEAVVGLSMLAAQQLPALLAAMQGTHERAAGEWQAEWDALPLLAASAAGAVAGAGRIVNVLQVFPERMRGNLDGEGGLIMAEAAMMALAPRLGRGAAHDAVYQACAQARAEARTLADVLGDEVPLDPEQYVGETDAIVTAALEGWATDAEAGTARR
jgi:3-carboxy-cis,cis-muconate cycloisomerase